MRQAENSMLNWTHSHQLPSKGALKQRFIQVGCPFCRPNNCINALKQYFSTFSVKQDPLQQFWLLTETMSFGRERTWPKAESGREFWESGAPPAGFGAEPRPQIHFGPTKSLENVPIVAANVGRSLSFYWAAAVPWNPWIPLGEPLDSAEP